MRQVVTTTTGDIDVLKVQEKPDPTPEPGEVLIRVKASGLNNMKVFASSIEGVTVFQLG